MKKFTFRSGHKRDPQRGMVIEVDRRGLPAAMQVGLSIDGKAKITVKGKPVPGAQRRIPIHDPVTSSHVDTQAHSVHHLTVDGDRPPNTSPTAHLVVHVAQKTVDGVTVGGISIEF